ncbi:hypothetical protein F0L68_31800 [Solihabitans fulvus]|uniref:Beta-lactamase class A n=1 Tax=Solihabitans fulvus TaxID=1892852 RepID=A0A5B2WTU9_9PSEU|nr:hypothetical protein F0L68_31800 [Solihabitans fulvus]
MQQAVRAVVPDAGVGLEVFDRQTGAVVTSLGADQQFASMSVVKLLIALDVLDSGSWVVPDEATQAQLHQMLSASDDGIADGLWDADGGPAIITRMASLMGLTGTQPPADPGEWGDTQITAQDVVAVYRYITDQLAPADRDLILGALSGAQQTAADGTDQFFGIPNGLPHATWAIKQGWGTSGSVAAFNTTGLVGAGSRYAVALLVSDASDSYGSMPEAVTAGIGALTSVLSPLS